MQDIDKARDVVKDTAGNVGMTKPEVGDANRQLTEYEQKRDNLFKTLLALLGQSDISSLDGDWRECCSTGRDALATLNDKVPAGSEPGLNGLGLANFFKGEQKIWEANGRAEIALAAKQMGTVHLTNVKLIQDCNEALKSVIDDNKDVQSLVQERFKETREVMKLTVSLLLAYRTVKRYAGLPPVESQVKSLGNVLTQAFTTVRVATQKKQALLKVLVARIELLKQTKSSLDKDAIVAAYNQAASVADGLPGIGRDNPYEARDWEQFGKDCKEKLADTRDRTVEDANVLFDNLYHTLDEETQKAFETLSDDPADLERWNDEIGDSFNSLQESLDNMDDYAKDSLSDGAFKAGFGAAVASAKAMVAVQLDDWKSTVENIKNSLRKG